MTNLVNHLVYKVNGQIIAPPGEVNKKVLAAFDIRHPVYYAGLIWEQLHKLASIPKAGIREIPRFPAMQRDIAMIVEQALAYSDIESTVKKLRLDKLQAIQLFDIFESEKLGAGKKSMAVSFTFLDEEKNIDR